MTFNLCDSQNPTAGTADQYYIIKKQPSSNMEGLVIWRDGGIWRDSICQIT